ncbi:helix-turn-helix transcriptional regulator [Pararobbsia silviterrae]|uniref:AraC family transcriptional regulator n=1 Tax=Pararobbsia silviterrae TaxID=1792498 RepID=A0A494XS20_9BURK|nr:AraC family transcriptional regulator [Pararobbsia silviterrae]RKP53430.1 AraC family transcriptional regulator [Pararobbsia silviterrae]
MPVKSPPLPALLYGEADAIRHTDARSLGDQIQRVFPGLNAYDPLGNPKHFSAKSRGIALPGVQVVASAISASSVDRDDQQQMTLMIPMAGQCTVTLDDKTFSWGVGRAGIYMPAFDGRVLGQGDARSLLMFNPQRDALERTARAMFGLAADEPVDLCADAPRLVGVDVAGHSLEPVWRGLGALIDAYRGDAALLARLGFDDIIKRHLVALLRPDMTAPHALGSKVEKRLRREVIDDLCDAMRSQPGKRWTLTEMEILSGLSARALQYMFKARFGCSPMDWLREQRLQLARRRLLQNDFVTISQLAQDCGFGAASQFSGLYKARFGVTPSRT